MDLHRSLAIYSLECIVSSLYTYYRASVQDNSGTDLDSLLSACMMDDVAVARSQTSHKAHQLVLTEIERNRVDSIECSWDTRSSIERTKGKKADITGMGRNRGARVQSFKIQRGVDEVDKVDYLDGIKYAALNPRIHRLSSNDAENRQIIREGMLYKTSREKITSNLIRDQFEHRQNRRFQLTEHSLDYTHLLQRVLSLLAI